jgi:predicted P-loop ATPase
VVRVQDMYRVIESEFVPEFHPFQYYLEHLPPWDGQSDYILEMSVSVNVRGDVQEQLLFAEYLKKWLVGMVAGWIDPQVVNNVILVLIGEQGSYKTTWFNYLLPPELRQYFYTKTNSSKMGRDDLLTLAQYGLVCCEELDTMRPSELNQLKAAVTMPSIDERAAYAHYHEHRKHIASFCGTGNNVQFLTDPTGNRRWLPFEVVSIESPREHPFNYEGIYAQAYALYLGGFRYWFSKAEIERLAKHNRQFETPRLETELLQQYFRKPVGEEPGEFVPVSLALQIVGANITQKLSTVSLGRAFVEQGFERRTFRNVRGYVVVRRSAEEMRSLRCVMAQGKGDADTDITDVF